MRAVLPKAFLVPAMLSREIWHDQHALRRNPRKDLPPAME
jgi:hypothetical protein